MIKMSTGVKMRYYANILVKPKNLCITKLLNLKKCLIMITHVEATIFIFVCIFYCSKTRNKTSCERILLKIIENEKGDIRVDTEPSFWSNTIEPTYLFAIKV
ncbi:hypothetical protein TCON_2126 [Astathelohania contejeani]|uniref:Uncharacterized protein n=1 Tax=Astathelohania contejeani TaxID=164912 RepID=A0ABQ7HWU3_9MICR|nr:hypothetical protein TCON_2126 [Thelohania contejeani]